MSEPKDDPVKTHPKSRWRAVGECVMNYDPRSYSMDIHPTPVRMDGPWHNTEAAAMSQMLDYMEAAPAWKWRVEGGVCEPQNGALSNEGRAH